MMYRKRIPQLILSVILLVGLVWENHAADGLRPDGAALSVLDGPSKAEATDLKRREDLAHAVCSTCHLFPEPDLLDRVSWAMEVLPKMRQMLGFAPIDYDKMKGGRLIQQLHPYPTAPVITTDNWLDICRYYLEKAPPKMPLQPARPAAEIGPNFLSATIPQYHREKPMTTLVQIDSAEKRIYVGDGETKTLQILNPKGRVLASTDLDSPPVSLVVKPEGFYLALIGDIYPSDEPNGQILFIEKPRPEGVRKRVIIDQLHRPTDIQFADLNGDGREDIVVCSYGNILGRFSWYENLGDFKYAEHVLLDRPGAIKAYVRDFNHDGRPDVIVLMAQAQEGIYLFLNEGHGDFLQKTIVEKPPAWGFSSFQLVDFNGDGFLDIITTNGDNGDYAAIPAPMKYYHGVRIYLNDGQNNFTEKYFYPLNGAYKAIAADFRRTGQLDIAAISFFPDFLHSPWESFVYLENQGGLHFKAFSPRESLLGRWFTMDAGDIDGDGTPDLVLGAFNHGPGRVLVDQSDLWRKNGASVLFLKNSAVKSGPDISKTPK